MTSFDALGVPVQFPFEPYPCQRDFIEKVIKALQQKENAMLESPTGTGKTLCLLCAVLSWQKFESQKNPNMPKSDQIRVIYASRTHSQLSQVVRELRKTAYQPEISVLGSREQYCINPDVQAVDNNSIKTYVCKAKIASKSCAAYKLFERGGPRSVAAVPIVADVEELIAFGMSHNICPYFLSRQRQESAELLFMPYNYLVDPKIQAIQNVNLSNSIVIFDEAHNIDRVCEDAVSFELTTASIAGCIKECQGVADLHNEYQDFSLALKGILIRLEALIADVQLPQDGVTKPGAEIYNMLAHAGITRENVDSIVHELEGLVAFILDQRGGKTSSCRLTEVEEIIKSLFGANKGSLSMQSYRLHIKAVNPPSSKPTKSASSWFEPSSSKEGRALCLWCFSPGYAMARLGGLGVRSVIIASGTLAPMASFANELKIPFPIKLENPHIIAAKQVFVRVVRKGPSGVELKSTYDSRSNVSYVNELGNTIVNFARIVPSGVLVFFPSYTMLKASIEGWKKVDDPSKKSIWDRIVQYKTPVVEPQSKQEFVAAMHLFQDKVKEGRGAMFFAVCRGKVSEGLDFADDMGRAVVITGLPFAPIFDPRVKLKKEYLNVSKDGLTGDEWYQQQASRAVNQAIGRVIRHKNDYGAIFLCDSRFAQPGNVAQLPSWLRPHLKVCDSFGEVLGAATRFFKESEADPTLRPSDFVVSTPALGPGPSRHVTIEYEKETNAGPHHKGDEEIRSKLQPLLSSSVLADNKDIQPEGFNPFASNPSTKKPSLLALNTKRTKSSEPHVSSIIARHGAITVTQGPSSSSTLPPVDSLSASHRFAKVTSERHTMPSSSSSTKPLAPNPLFPRPSPVSLQEETKPSSNLDLEKLKIFLKRVQTLFGKDSAEYQRFLAIVKHIKESKPLQKSNQEEEKQAFVSQRVDECVELFTLQQVPLIDELFSILPKDMSQAYKSYLQTRYLSAKLDLKRENSDPYSSLVKKYKVDLHGEPVDPHKARTPHYDFQGHWSVLPSNSSSLSNDQILAKPNLAFETQLVDSIGEGSLVNDTKKAPELSDPKHNSKKGTQPDACTICHKPPSAPFAAPTCGHVACYSCFVEHFQGKERVCPVAGCPTPPFKLSGLRKIHFY